MPLVGGGTLEIPEGRRKCKSPGNLVCFNSTPSEGSCLTHWKSDCPELLFNCCNLNCAVRAVAWQWAEGKCASSEWGTIPVLFPASWLNFNKFSFCIQFRDGITLICAFFARHQPAVFVSIPYASALSTSGFWVQPLCTHSLSLDLGNKGPGH